MIEIMNPIVRHLKLYSRIIMQKILQLSDIVGIVLEYCDIPDCITVFEITGKPEKQEEYIENRVRENKFIDIDMTRANRLLQKFLRYELFDSVMVILPHTLGNSYYSLFRRMPQKYIDRVYRLIVDNPMIMIDDEDLVFHRKIRKEYILYYMATELRGTNRDVVRYALDILDMWGKRYILQKNLV
jgi:hypothetical protein